MLNCLCPGSWLSLTRSLRCGVHPEAAGPVSGVRLAALVPGRQRQVQERDERGGEGAERPVGQSGWKTAANYEPHPEEAGHLPAGTFLGCRSFQCLSVDSAVCLWNAELKSNKEIREEAAVMVVSVVICMWDVSHWTLVLPLSPCRSLSCSTSPWAAPGSSSERTRPRPKRLRRRRTEVGWCSDD